MTVGRWYLHDSVIIGVGNVEEKTSHIEDGYYFQVLTPGGVIKSPIYDSKDAAEEAYRKVLIVITNRY
jgi:hypothetical protein